MGLYACLTCTEPVIHAPSLQVSKLPAAEQWRLCCALEATIPALAGLGASLQPEGIPGDWEQWLKNLDSHAARLPGEWHTQLSNFQQLLVIKVGSACLAHQCPAVWPGRDAL